MKEAYYNIPRYRYILSEIHEEMLILVKYASFIYNS